MIGADARPVEAKVEELATTMGATFDEILRVVGDFEKRFNQSSPA
ncbi:MAG: hypothetical protein ACLP2Y_17715 [Limisphaerales bacterium]